MKNDFELLKDEVPAIQLNLCFENPIINDMSKVSVFASKIPFFLIGPHP